MTRPQFSLLTGELAGQIADTELSADVRITAARRVAAAAGQVLQDELAATPVDWVYAGAAARIAENACHAAWALLEGHDLVVIVPERSTPASTAGQPT